MSKPIPESLRCSGTGRDTMLGATYPFKTMLPNRRRFYCGHCGKRVMAELTGHVGRYHYAFLPHLRQGVTRKTLAQAQP